jgi:UDP-galactose transporter B1
MWLGFVSLSYLLAMLSSNEALRSVSYPSQALAKSCKMVPVMLGNVFVGVKYGIREYITVAVLTLGVALFQLSETKNQSNQKKKEDTYFGMILLLLSLFLDGITGSHQQLLDKEYKLSSHDLMFGMNMFAFLFTFVALIFSGEGERGLQYVIQHPSIQIDVLLFALASAMGQNFIFYTITGPGPLACTMITTTRKFFTILISVLSHADNSLAEQQWLGVALVFTGLSLEISEKMEKDRHRKQNVKKQE